MLTQATALPDPTGSPYAHPASSEPAIFKRVLDTDVNLCIWQRNPNPKISAELARIGPMDLPDVRTQCSLENFDAAIQGLLVEQGLKPELFAHWRDDLLKVAGHYFPLTAGRKVTVRLETTDQDGCRRFHTDRTNLRLLCTYRGPGTEWLPNDQVDREAQLTGAPNEAIIRHGEPSRLETFWVGLLKGAAYPGNSINGLVHRSPPARQLGATRVLFCLDC